MLEVFYKKIGRLHKILYFGASKLHDLRYYCKEITNNQSKHSI